MPSPPLPKSLLFEGIVLDLLAGALQPGEPTGRMEGQDGPEKPFWRTPWHILANWPVAGESPHKRGLRQCPPIAFLESTPPSNPLDLPQFHKMLDFVSFIAQLLLPSTLLFSPPEESVQIQTPSKSAELPGNAPSLHGPFTDHFQQWLQESGYGQYNFTSLELGLQASFGGKQSDGHEVKRRPVLFLHGNSDGALAEGAEEWNQGWSASIGHFMAQGGYSTAELYALTYGDRNLANSLKRSVDCQTLLRLRRFLEAILAYTKADKVDIVAHSMGVTLARHIVQGRSMLELGSEKSSGQDPLEQCYLGPPLRHRVHTLLGLAGANYGLCLCTAPGLEGEPACSRRNGFWASSGCPDAQPEECAVAQPRAHQSQCHGGGQYAAWLHRLNAPQRPKDAHFVVSLWSSGDQLLGPTNFAWGRLTSLIPNSDHSAIYSGHSHHSIKWATVRDQLEFLAEGQGMAQGKA